MQAGYTEKLALSLFTMYQQWKSTETLHPSKQVPHTILSKLEKTHMGNLSISEGHHANISHVLIAGFIADGTHLPVRTPET